MFKTLKIYSYRGYNVYLRGTADRNYEYLIAFNGGILCYNFYLQKPKKNEVRLTKEEGDRKMITEMMVAANTNIDNSLLTRSEKKIINKRLEESKK